MSSWTDNAEGHAVHRIVGGFSPIFTTQHPRALKSSRQGLLHIVNDYVPAVTERDQRRECYTINVSTTVTLFQ
jgi:hypothetical protein